MNELMEIITTETQRTRYGIIQLSLTMHEGKVRCVNVTTTKKHNLTPNSKEKKNGQRN